MILCASTLATGPGSRSDGDDGSQIPPKRPLAAIQASQLSPEADRSLKLVPPFQLSPPARSVSSRARDDTLASAKTIPITRVHPTPAPDKFNPPDQLGMQFILRNKYQEDILDFTALGTVLFERLPANWTIETREVTVSAALVYAVAGLSALRGAVPMVRPFRLCLKDIGTLIARINIQFLLRYAATSEYVLLSSHAAHALADNAVQYPIVPAQPVVPPASRFSAVIPSIK